MRLIAFSDLHGKSLDHIDVNGADICVIAGDIAPLKGFSIWDLNKQVRWMQTVFGEFVERNSSTEFVFVAGNHDFWGERVSLADLHLPKNSHCLCNGTCKVLGLRFWGSPNVPYIGSSHRWAFETSDISLKHIFSTIPDGTDIVVTHTPPNVHGSTIDRSVRNEVLSSHFGSEALTDALERVQPQFAFCGHIHAGSHDCTEIGITKCFNVSLLDEDYKIAYAPLEIDM